jgi:hypothetical protein
MERLRHFLLVPAAGHCTTGKPMTLIKPAGRMVLLKPGSANCSASVVPLFAWIAGAQRPDYQWLKATRPHTSFPQTIIAGKIFFSLHP